MKELGTIIYMIDMAVLNFCPFEQKSKNGGDFVKRVENIDIGGPLMLRSTAKNYVLTTVVTSPEQYNEVIACMTEKGDTSLELRKRFAARALFALSAS